jgi:hypothetical protein
VTAPKTQQPINLSLILSSNFEIKTEKEENWNKKRGFAQFSFLR